MHLPLRALLLAPSLLLSISCGRPSAGAHTDGPLIEVPGGAFVRDGRAVAVAAFRMDRAPVSVGDFRAFAGGTALETRAERDGGAVFSVGAGWQIRPEADYAHPYGDGVPAPVSQPVTQVTAQEAEAFCAARGARLPNEDEWEHAARNARGDGGAYPWGDSLIDERGAYRANVWQGSFPDQNTLEDGYLFASPIGAFAPTPLGFLDLVGNVWQWTASSWRDTGPASPALPETGNAATRVIRGGSFLCEARVCHGYRVSARQHAEASSAMMHLGFRCVE